MSDHRAADILVAFGAGVVIGAAAGVLLAPASGEETRRRIGAAGRTAIDKAKEGMDVAMTRAREGVESAKTFAKDQAHRMGEAYKEGKEAYVRESAKG